ncbi:stage II sporulation protein M [Brockia lithotrophica]|uniref:Putative membrane protein SpoIIM required for sporulation n=1 Tax=Brockia lithotrophica TaxID=933949 RepID=A0A660KTS3_9BACL|nr:stage II sporulation protein M [Brockia lithotrophica]RKQ84115.1 putative membrane protein SpoIIM required for sporulation [Brockia lithotrophica]
MNIKIVILQFLRMERRSIPHFLKAFSPYLADKPLFHLFYRVIEVLMSSALVLFLVIRASDGWGPGVAGTALLVFYTYTFLFSAISIRPDILQREYNFSFYRMSRTSDESLYRSVLWVDVAARWLYHLPRRLPFMVGSMSVMGMRAIPLMMLGDALALAAYMHRATRGLGETAGLQTLRAVLKGILERGIVGLFAYGIGVLTARFLEIIRGVTLHRGISLETWLAAEAAVRSEVRRFLEAFSLSPSAVTAFVEGPMWIGALLFVPGLVLLAVFYSTRFQIEPAVKTFRMPRLIVERCLSVERSSHRLEGAFVLDRLRLLRRQDRLAHPWWMWGVPTGFVAALAFVLPVLQLAHNPYARAFLFFIVFFFALRSVADEIQFYFQDVFYYRSDLRRLPLYHLLGVERLETFLRSKMELLSCLVRRIAGVPLVILGTVAFIFLGVHTVILGVVAALVFHIFLKGAVFLAASFPYRRFLLAFQLKEFRLRPPEEERIEEHMFQIVVDYPQRVLVYASILGSLIVAMFGLVRGAGWLVYGLAFFGIWTLFLMTRYREAFGVTPEREKWASLSFWLSATGASLFVFGIGVVGGFAVSGGLGEIIGAFGSIVSPSLSWETILFNNARVALLLFALGLVSFGFGALLVLLFQGFVLGGSVRIAVDAVGWELVFRKILPHAFLEIAAVSLIAGASFTGLRVLRSIRREGRISGELLRTWLQEVAWALLLGAILLTVAAFVEAYVSSRG